MSTPLGRYEQHSIGASERPRVMYTYYATGRGRFPFDMLRYDACWPADSEGAHAMHGEYDASQRSIKMHSYRIPTIERWNSFVWSVGLEKL